MGKDGLRGKRAEYAVGSCHKLSACTLVVDDIDLTVVHLDDWIVERRERLRHWISQLSCRIAIVQREDIVACSIRRAEIALGPLEPVLEVQEVDVGVWLGPE